MKKQKVVSVRNLPTRPPIILTVVIWLLLDRLKAPGYVWGILGTLICFMWIAFVVGMFNEDMTDIWPKEPK
jgi:hypothetical protein